ncbi:type II secretion system protein M [Thiomicrospira microaerophila]|uniref:type II secretion system protein GspM n=1 Tax=Thiomicrospira microaerophila TaxID=406020 RepID=UPI00200D84F0|nr:type II secretion system protein GspM [Thiomicrospira microaerophila]UQB41708.1 type II secretion system protein M [Thiomicrospira microaerophila]
MFMQTEMGLQLAERWQALAARERLLIQLLFVVLIGLVGYRLVAQPLLNQQNQAQQQWLIAEQQWQWLNQQVPAIQQAQATHQTAGSEVQTQSQLLAHLQQSLRSHQLINQMTSIRPAANGVQLQFNQVEAPRFFQWLAQLEQQGLSPERMQVEPVSLGKVKVSLNFRLAS